MSQRIDCQILALLLRHSAWTVVPAQDGADEGEHSCHLAAHPDAITLDDALSNMGHEIKIIVPEARSRAVGAAPAPTVGVKVERGDARVERGRSRLHG